MVRLYDRQGNLVSNFVGHQDGVTSVAFSPDGSKIVSGSIDDTIRLWDREGNPIGEPFRGHEDAVSSVAFSPDGRYIVSGSHDDTIRLWDLEGNSIGQPFRGHEDDIRSVGFSPDSRYIVSGSNDGTVRLWQVGDWQIWLEIACDRLRNHPILVNPEDNDLAKAAGKTCLKYGKWNEIEKAQFFIHQGRYSSKKAEKQN